MKVLVDLQVMRMNLPEGPTSLAELFQWPRFNAQKLLVESPQSAELRTNFRELLKYDIEIHDSYSGTGTGSVTLHLQHKHMMSAPLRLFFLVNLTIIAKKIYNRIK